MHDLSSCVLYAGSESMDDTIAEYSVIFLSIFHGDKIAFAAAGNFNWTILGLKQELRLWLAWK